MSKSKISFSLLLSLFLSFFLGCSTPLPKAVPVQKSTKKIDFLDDVKPILDKRCVVCHSCYNSPCQAKMSSFEGIQRGGSKKLVYDALRLKAIEPTRLFTDANSTQGWREKGFYSLVESSEQNQSFNDSIMFHLLYDKKLHPEVIGSYKPEQDKLICPRNKKELAQYFEEKPNHGMPYGFPAISEKEYQTLSQWIATGAKGPTKQQQIQLTSPNKTDALAIQKWENFLNKQDPKHSVTARYLYEHLFLAHIHFSENSHDFYRLIRSYTPSPQPISVIATVRPFDDPKVKKFYYRFRKIHSTIVHKTHMVFTFDEMQYKRFHQLFIEQKWDEKPHYINYETQASANPFISFSQIPAQSRYQFLLDNSHYIVMTFIRGPVCRGQMALNVIHDHFWVMFTDPKHDLTIQTPHFLDKQSYNLSMPIESPSESVFKTFSDEYRTRYMHYFKAKQDLYLNKKEKPSGLDFIWRGERAQDAPLLTVYRHFDSASVHKGILGAMPRTLWIIDYPQLERIYYTLVAGYDVFGNISHQTNIRRYMDFLRLEGELNFITLMPADKRKEILFSWYKGDDMLKNIIEDTKNITIFKKATALKYKTPYPKDELIQKIVNEHILKTTNIHFDELNYFKPNQKHPKMPKQFCTKEDFTQAVRSATAPGTGFIKHITDEALNTVMVKVIMPDKTSFIATIVVNRWHNNVNSMFNEKSTLDSSKDTLDFLPYSIGSYPNAFAVVHHKELPDFFDLVENFDDTPEYIKKIEKYFINRSHPQFWETYDWFQERFNQENGIESGLYDLNRYYYK